MNEGRTGLRPFLFVQFAGIIRTYELFMALDKTKRLKIMEILIILKICVLFLNSVCKR